MVLGDGYPLSLPLSASDAPQTMLPGRGSADGGEGRGDGFQSPQSRYFDGPVIDDAAGQHCLKQPSFCMPEAAVTPETELSQFANDASGASSGTTDNWGFEQFDKTASFEPSFPSTQLCPTFVQFVPCTYLVPRAMGWPVMMRGLANPRAANRTVKRNFAREMNMAGHAGAERGTVTAKAKPRSSALSSVAFGTKQSAQQGLLGSERAPTVDLKASPKSLDRPSAVTVDLSCLSRALSKRSGVRKR